MNYELAKQLKEAGFPQELGSGSRLYDLNGKSYVWDYYSDESYDLSKDGYCKIPTLSELISACGEGFHSLDCYHNAKKWLASGCHFPDIDKTELSEGETPEESVAKLWLKLNK